MFRDFISMDYRKIKVWLILFVLYLYWYIVSAEIKKKK